MRPSGFLLAQAVATAVVLRRLARGRTRRPPLAAPSTSARSRVTVIVPARDEEHRLPGVLGPLRDEGAALEVLVVDDRSSDATAAVATSFGARVIAGAEPPPGWVGKPWALEQGLREARGDIVVCLDADCEPRPGLLAALAEALDDGADLVTGAVRLRCEGRAERLLHPAMLTTLLVRFASVDAAEGTAPPPVSRLLANGQCLAFGPDALREAGGFALAAGHLTDDVALARALARQGWTVRFVDASDLLAVRMYAGARDTWTGWGRSIALADVTPPAIRALDVATVWLVVALPGMRALARRAGPLDWALLALRAALLAATARAYAPRGPWYWLSPLADVPAAVRLSWSALRPSRTWRGRRY